MHACLELFSHGIILGSDFRLNLSLTSVAAGLAAAHTDKLALALERQEEILREARSLLFHGKACVGAGPTDIGAIELKWDLADALTLKYGVSAHRLPATSLLHNTIFI